MRALRFILALGALSLAGCVGDAREEQPETTPPAAESSAPSVPAPSPPVLTADFTAEGGTQITGTVALLEAADAATAFRVSLNLQHVPAGPHAWHIHEGACGLRDGQVVVPFTEDKDRAAIAAPLVAGSDGIAVVDAAVPASLLTLEQLRSGDYSLHVHQNAGADHGPTIACATL